MNRADPVENLESVEGVEGDPFNFRGALLDAGRSGELSNLSRVIERAVKFIGGSSLDFDLTEYAQGFLDFFKPDSTEKDYSFACKLHDFQGKPFGAIWIRVLKDPMRLIVVMPYCINKDVERRLEALNQVEEGDDYLDTLDLNCLHKFRDPVYSREPFDLKAELLQAAKAGNTPRLVGVLTRAAKYVVGPKGRIDIHESDKITDISDFVRVVVGHQRVVQGKMVYRCDLYDDSWDGSKMVGSFTFSYHTQNGKNPEQINFTVSNLSDPEMDRRFHDLRWYNL